MQTTSTFMSGFHFIVDWVLRISALNFIVVLINLPIVVGLFLLAISPVETSVLLLWGIPLFLLSILLFFPSVVAVFAVCRDWVMKNEVTSIWKKFWTYFAQNYTSALRTGMILTVMWSIFGLDFYYVQQWHEMFTVIFAILGVFLFAFTLIYLSINVHFEMNRKEQVKNALLVTFGRPILTLIIVLLNLTILYINISYMFVFLFFSITLSALVSFSCFYRFTLKMKEKAE